MAPLRQVCCILYPFSSFLFNSFSCLKYLCCCCWRLDVFQGMHFDGMKTQAKKIKPLKKCWLCTHVCTFLKKFPSDICMYIAGKRLFSSTSTLSIQHKKTLKHNFKIFKRPMVRLESMLMLKWSSKLLRETRFWKA